MIELIYQYGQLVYLDVGIRESMSYTIIADNRLHKNKIKLNYELQKSYNESNTHDYILIYLQKEA